MKTTREQIIKKLNTHEDSLYIHKTLGLIVLCNYIYRFCKLISRYDMNLNNQISMILLIFHSLLSLSSLSFRLSNVRNRKIPIIYPEFRMHNIIFALRSVFCCVSFYYFKTNNDYSTICNICICLLTMKVADIITNYYEKQTPKTTTMRNMPYDENMKEQKLQNLKKIYSFMQFYATYYMLGNINSAYNPMFAIQISSFLMTLVKKNIIPPMVWHPLYFSSLMLNVFIFLTLNPIFILKMNIACYFFCYWRMTLGYNKYIGWLIVFMFHYNIWNSSFYKNVDIQNLHVQKILIMLVIIYHYSKYSPI
jgi:hypothetical protein